MKYLSKYIDPLQIIGFTLSLAVAIGLVLAKQDTLFGLLVGLTLAALTQLFDIQARMTASTDKVIESLGNVADTQFLNMREFGQHLIPSVSKAKHFVLDTVLNRVAPEPSSPSYFSGGNQAEYRRLLYDRVSKGEIVFQRVEAIFHKQSLETVIFRLLLHEGFRYFIRHYEPPPKPIPVVHLMSFDDESFYLGGFHYKEAAGEEKVLYIREPRVAQLLNNYWTVLWDGATPLNERGIINWEELKRIGLRTGMTESEFEAMVSKVKNEVQREKRQLRRK